MSPPTPLPSTAAEPLDIPDVWGNPADSQTTLDGSIRIIYQNINNLSSNASYDTLATVTKIAGLALLQPDCVMLAETGVFWGNNKQKKITKQAFYEGLGKGSVHTAHNTQFAPSRHNPNGITNHLAGGVCQWFGSRMCHRIANVPADHLGRFAISLVHGPSNQGIAIITAYRPVASGNGETSVYEQHRQHLGSNADPREECLQDLGKEIIALQEEGYLIIVGIDANEQMPDNNNPAKGIAKFVLDTGMVDPIEHIHGTCPFPTSSARSGSPIDFFLCSEELLPFISVGILATAQGGSSDHRALSMDIAIHSLWNSSVEEANESRPRGFRAGNTTKSFEFVTALHSELAGEVMEEIAIMHETVASRRYDPSIIHARLEDLDRDITSKMLAAEEKVGPSKTASSHEWSPDLVRKQQKANLLQQALRCFKIRNSMSQQKRASFIDEARRIDEAWCIPMESAESLKAAIMEASKEAKDALKRKKELRKIHLEQRIDEMTRLGSADFRIRAARTIKRIEQQRSTHSSIRSILKPREPPIAFVIKDGIRLAGAEMNDAFVQYNAHHFQQPPRNGASAAIPGQVLQDLSPHDEEGLMNRMEHAYTNYYSILDGVYDLGKVQEFERPFYEQLQRRCDPIEAMGRPMTYEEMNQYWIKLPERTSSSPSGRHVGLYKAMHVCIPTEEAGKLQKELATMFLQINNICILSGHVLTRWKLATNIMLPKKTGVHDINKMRCISLLEADLNLVLKLKFSKHVMRSIEDHPSGSLLADNQNGFRPNRSTDQAVLGNRISIDIAHQHRTPFATLETDCKSAFDCCDPNLTVIAHLRLGVPEVLSKLMSEHLHCTTFNVRAGGVTSATQYGGPGKSFGSGQGGGASGFNWIVNQDVTNCVLEAHAIKACTIHDPRSGEIRHRNGFVFADDMNFLAMSTTEVQSIETICHNLNTIGQTASDCIRASGGSFGLPKCSWRCSTPFNNNKIQDEYPSDFPLQLTSPATTQPSMIHQMEAHQPHRQLGVHLVPSLSPKYQIQLLTNRSNKLKVTLRRNSITAHQAATIFEHYIAPAISYPCTTQSMTTSEIDKLQNITFNPILAKLSMASTSARNMLYLPAKFGGAGFKRWSMEILAQQIALLINQVDSQEWIGFVLRASMNISQLEFGRATHFLEYQHRILKNTITPTWITSIQSNAVAKSLLTIHGGWTPPKQRERDIHIGDLPEYTAADLSDHQLRLFHQTFQALQITTLADIVDASGKTIRLSSFNCTTATPSPYKWPTRKTTITREHKEVWQAVLNRLVSNSRTLYSQLGQWLVAPNKMLPYQKSNRGLIHIQPTGEWHLHLQVTHRSQRLTRHNDMEYQSEFEVVQPFAGQRWVTDACISTTGVITVQTVDQANLLHCSDRPPPQVSVVHTWQQFEKYIKSTNEGQQGCIFDAIIGDLPVRHHGFHDLCNLLLDDIPIYASTDGSVRSDLRSASASWLFWKEADDANFREPSADPDATASPIVVLTCGTKIVHGRFESMSSYRAEGTGLLIIPFLAAHLQNYLNLVSPPQINHNCDNQELIVKVKSMLPTKRAWWWNDVTDSDLICESLHWGQQIKWTPRWERGHPERRLQDRSLWSTSEWGNHFADGLAGEAWSLYPEQYRNNPCAPILPHAQSLQLQFPDGTISGKIKQNLPPIINTKIGLQQLARYIHYSDEQMINIDWPNYHISSKSSTSTALSRAHACKAFNNQWYTDALAHKYNSDLSPTCRCCQSNRNETIAHIIGCPSRAQTHDEFHPQVTAHFQACRIGDHLLSALELGIEIVLSDTDSHRGERWRGNDEGSDVEQQVASFLDDETVSEQIKEAFSSQVLLGWEDAFQGRFSIKWSAISTPEDMKWIPGFLKILMNWSRACWSKRRQTLFGEKKDRYRLQRERLFQHVNYWYDAPREQRLIDKTKLEPRERILTRNNDAIAKWLDNRHADRTKLKKALNRNNGQTTMLRFLIPAENRRENNQAFQTRIQEARRASLPTSSNTVDGDQSSEEPPD